MKPGKSFSLIKSNLLSVLVMVCLLYQATVITSVHADQGQASLQSDNPNPPTSVVKLIFIHHSTGQNWLADDNGGLGIALGQNNYFVSDTNYGWGPDAIGDSTDIPNWLDWFRSPSTPTYMAALYAESGQHSSYTRTLADLGGENEIIMFKSCFPNSALSGNPNDPPSADGWLTVGHAKYVYNQLLIYFREHPNKLFVVITAPPLSDPTYAANARAFNQWLMNDWLQENNYPLQNVAIFDFYNVLTGPDNHHRYYNGQVQHVFTAGLNTLYYPSGDDHPSQTGNLKARNEFVPLLNIFYHRWKDSLATPTIQGCPIFPADNIWNARVDGLPVDAHSSQWIDAIGRSTGFHMDFGSGTWNGGPIGIPYNLVDESVPKVPVSFEYANESDVGPYPIPTNPLIEYGSDHHILMLERTTCTLYEIYHANYSAGAWSGGSGAIWALNSDALRPDTWTSADAAGLPILPGLARYDEIAAGEINHALRFTAENTAGYIWPARHQTADPQDGIPPMGARFRLKASFNITGYPAEMQIILQAMKKYGIILADNGSNWYVSGAPDERWDNDMLHLLDDLTGADFDAVDVSSLMVDPDSGATQPGTLTLSGNVGIAGATLNYTDGTSKTATADGSGNYAFTVSYNWSGTVTPAKTGYTFSPVNRIYSNVVTDQTAQNYTATLITYTISGNAEVAGANLSYIEDGTPKTATADGSGNYSFLVPYNWSGTVTPWKSGSGFTPASRTYTNVLGNQSGQNYTASACSTTDVTIAGSLSGSYCLTSGQSTRQSYAANNGPVKISTAGTPILAAQRILYYGTGTQPTSFVEMMGLPAGQLDTTYWFPWYKNDGIVDTQLRIGNVSGSTATVHIYVAGVEVTGSPFTLTTSGAGQSQRLSFALNDGPVKVVSDQNIVATERLIYFNSGDPASFSEMMGLPNNQLSNTYWFPWYKNIGEVDTQLRIGNVSGSTATVHIYIAGVEVTGSPFTLTASGAGQSQRLSFALNNGPVKIVSDVNIVAAERLIYSESGLPTSFVETMGIPDGQLGTTQWFPWYKNDGIVDTQLRIGNVSGTAASVHVYIGTAEMAGSPFALTATGAGQSLRLSFTANDGPMKLVSDQNIVASERLIYFLSGAPVSFSEMMGLPDSQLSPTWWLPWYKNVGEIDTQLRFGVP